MSCYKVSHQVVFMKGPGIDMMRMLNLAQAKDQLEIEEHSCSWCRVRTKLIAPSYLTFQGTR
jgi:hypothetical protein